MFWNRNKIKKDMIRSINPSSKASLKVQCLMMSNGDIDKAERLYDFLAKDMPTLPDYDPLQPSTMQQVKDTAAQTVSWLNENKDNIMDWVGIIRGMFGKGSEAAVPPSAPLPPING